ncbi:hypothetical protein C2S51_003424 [Perilla frutescens var. frutescens]|nr:hypothetical protein C2S51_003424 [Perilla frutescens var. frutescens]
MDPSLSSSSSSSEDVSQLSPDHDNDTKISSSDIMKRKRKAPESSSDNELEAGSELRESTGSIRPGLNDGLERKIILCSALQSHQIILCSAVQSHSQLRLTSKKYKYITVKVKNPHGEPGEDEEKMIEYEAVCLWCPHSFNADNVLKTKCKCKKFALIHEHCQPADEDCSNCKQRMEYVPVTLFKDCQPTSSNEKVDQKCW